MLEREINIEATRDNYKKVLDFVEGILEETNCPQGLMLTVDICLEEIYINIASYAYSSEDKGNVCIKIIIEEEPYEVEIIFRDRGHKFNPLEKPDPDTALSVEESGVGGLGIFMVKNMMDEVIYRYENNENILTMRKKQENKKV